MKYLFAAYVVTWVIHGSYIAYLVSRFRRVEQERRELGNE